MIALEYYQYLDVDRQQRNFLQYFYDVLCRENQGPQENGKNQNYWLKTDQIAGKNQRLLNQKNQKNGYQNLL